MAKRRTGAWRDEAASGLAAQHAMSLALEGPCLIMEDTRSELAEALASLDLEVVRWHRRALGGRAASPWPPAGPFGTVAIRLPKAKDELEMLVHAAASSLASGGRLLVYGAKDEGIGSAPRRIETVFADVETLATGGRCRVLKATRPLVVAGLRGSLDEWRTETELPLSELERPWISFPGVFANGRLDAGTKLFLANMPRLTGGARVLDFACGSGLIGAVLLARQPKLMVDFLDVDAAALAAVELNVPGARTVLSDGLSGVGPEPYDAIVANPPYHRRTARTVQVIAELAKVAARRLTSQGSLTLVVQRGLRVRGFLEESFGDLDTVAEDTSYRVLMAWAPRPTSPEPSGSRPTRLPVYSKATARGTSKRG